MVESSALSAQPLSAQTFDLTTVWHCVDQWNAMQSDFSETVKPAELCSHVVSATKRFSGISNCFMPSHSHVCNQATV